MTLLGLVPLPIVLGVAAAVAAGVICLVIRRKPSMEELERRRRSAVSAKGRAAAATVLDLRGDQLYFSYKVRGVEYTASQDISALRDRLPTDPSALVGAATVKYRPSNPADSIVVAEDWSGLRAVPPPADGGEERNLL